MKTVRLLAIVFTGCAAAWLIFRAVDPPAGTGSAGPGQTAGSAATGGSGGDTGADTPARRLGREAEQLDARGDHAASAIRFTEAAKLADAEGNARLARTYRAQSGVCLKLSGQPEQAREVLLPALAEARANDDRHTIGLALGNLARVESLLGNDAEGIAYLDQLAAFAREEHDARLEVLTLEQAASGALSLRDAQGALARLAAALPLAAELEQDAALPADDRRHAALLSLQATALAALGDDAEADRIWTGLPQTSAVLGNRATHSARLGLHERAADFALRAAHGFDAEGSVRGDERDRALLLHLSELLAAGATDACEKLLAKLIAGEQDELALAPFLVMRARAALARGVPVDALADLQRARTAYTDTPSEHECGLLLAWSLLANEQVDDAGAVLASLPDSLARRFLMLRALTKQPPESSLISEAQPLLRAEEWRPGDTSLTRLRELVASPMPSLALAALEAGLADLARFRGQGSGAGGDAMANVVLLSAVRQALRWQAIESVTRVFGVVPDAQALAVAGAWVDRWVDRQRSSEEALVVVLPGEPSSYLVLCAHELGVTTFALPGLAALAGKVGAVVEQLHGTDVQRAADAAHALHDTLFGSRARADLAGAARWTMILPPELLAVPPTMYVSVTPAADGPIAWLVKERLITLLPHAPMPGAAADVAPQAAGGSPAEPVGWLSLGAPDVDRTRLGFVAEAWFAIFGEGVFNVAPAKPVQPGVALSGARATVAALRLALPRTSGLQLSLPGAAGDRLGGLLFAPDDSVAHGDERAGFLPWHRLAQLSLPPQVILDSTRFEPTGIGGGADLAAGAVLAHARQLLLTRWPLPPPIRDAMVANIQEQRTQGRSLPDALAVVQRDWLAAADATGDNAMRHPRLWAAWLPFGAD